MIHQNRIYESHYRYVPHIPVLYFRGVFYYDVQNLLIIESLE